MGTNGLWLLAAGFSLFLLLGCTGNSGCEPCQNQTGGAVANESTQPIHTPTEIRAFLEKHLVIYYGIADADISEPTYAGGEWQSDVRFAQNGGLQRLRVSVSDTDLSVKELWLGVIQNKEPVGITPITGKTSCSEGGKIKVIEFANPYCSYCVASERSIEVMKARFNDSIDYEYRVMLPITNSMIEEYGYTNVSLTSKYYACAQKQGQEFLGKLRKCVMARYEKQVGEPLQGNWLDSCTIDEGLNTTEMKSCVADADRLLDVDMKLGQTYLGTYAQLPTFVIDCRFRTSNPDLVRYAICYEFPETEGC
ncbi:MAG: DsbA family protein [Candidatus Micrarchaeota archaeon]